MRRVPIAAGLLALAVALPAGPPAQAAEQNVTLDAQTGLSLAIYNDNLALVRDRRLVTVANGENDLAFVDVSAQIKPETALLTSPGGKLDVVEQNFDFDLLTPRSLLEKSVGRMVRVVTVDSDGDETVEDARLLSAADGGVVLKIGDRIETQPPGRIVFSEVPASLSARPTLVTKVMSDSAGKMPVELSYLTGGLHWSADYIAELAPDESRIELKGWVTLTNSSGTGYRDARLQLVAGTVHQVRPAMVMMMKAEPMAGAAPAPMAEQPLFEYHLYTLPRPTTIADKQTKQVELLTGHAIPVRKDYRFSNIFSAFAERQGEPRRVNADVRLGFDNTEADGLGMPLPKGIVRVYKADAQGQSLFIGEDAIDHTPKNEAVDLDLGQAFDITARGRQTAFDKLGDHVFESAYEVDFKNAKPQPVSVTLAQAIPGAWKILQESAAHKRQDASTASWQVDIPAEGKAKLTYKVRVTD